MSESAPLKRFSAVYLAGGSIRRMTFEAPDLAAARQQAEQWGVGVEGEVEPPRVSPSAMPPEAYDVPTARRLIGGISRATLYNWLALGRLRRVPDTRKVLITRASIERLCGARN